MCFPPPAPAVVAPQVALHENHRSFSQHRWAAPALRGMKRDAARESAMTSAAGQACRDVPRPATPRPAGAWRSVADTVSPACICQSRAEEASPRRRSGPRMVAQTTQGSQKRVCIDLSAQTVHEITPYAEVYGIHPREFAFERSGFMVLLAPGTGNWFKAATIRHAASYVESDDSDDAVEEFGGDPRSGAAGGTASGVWMEDEIVDDGWVLLCPGR
eukprot:TRINITY_DN21568_c0_g1_i1.p1 TRINITY_DN21568_c0_g1~~TRINITY_DN21568_c0_g1_i1.p1  ORF type:complete len:216 (+),score=25.70 TRINITY_DN21568_c0_g1_i1:63-710(+)